MSELVLEIHVPLVETPGLTAHEYKYPWIERVEEFLEQLEVEGDAQLFDDGEEFRDHYVFFICGAGEQQLIQAATRVAGLDGVPAGTSAYVSTGDAEEWGQGRRVPLTPGA